MNNASRTPVRWTYHPGFKLIANSAHDVVSHLDTQRVREADAILAAEAPAMADLLRDLVKFTTAMHVGAHNPADAIRMHHAARAILARIDGEAR